LYIPGPIFFLIHVTIASLHSNQVQTKNESDPIKSRVVKGESEKEGHLLGPLAIIRLVNAINEEVDSGETLHIVLLPQFILLRGIHLRQNDIVALELGGGGGVLRREGLAVAAPRRVKFDHDEAVVLDDVAEILLLQNDDVLLVNLRRLVGLGVVLEVVEVAVIGVIGEVVVVVVRRGGLVFEEAEVFIVVVRGGAEGGSEGGEEEESGEGEEEKDSHCESEGKNGRN